MFSLSLFALSAVIQPIVPPGPAPTPGQIQPWVENPRYWQIDGQPVVLLGGSSEDNLFQIPGLLAELDVIAGVGGNVVRNTMSDRDPGDARAFLRLPDGRYDLAQWNPVYWEKFETFLRETAARGIVVQIEVWDRFDHSRQEWKTDPYNPANNINYAFAESGFVPDYPNHPGRNEQPFFFTVPALHHNRVVLPYQQAFVRKLLAHSLRYDHVLYCMDNETLAAEEWGAYWAEFIRAAADAQGRRVYLTEMWDTWDVTSPIHRLTTDRPDRYDFVDLSQNSQVVGEANWRNAQTVRQRLAGQPRPINSTKIYGHDGHASAAQGKDTAHAVACFWRSLLGGFASARFHRPSHGLGISATAQIQLRAARQLLAVHDVRRAVPDATHAHLVGRSEDGAYLSYRAGESAAVFFPRGQPVTLRLDGSVGLAGHALQERWLSLATGAWRTAADAPFVPGGVEKVLTPPDAGAWVAVVVR